MSQNNHIDINIEHMTGADKCIECYEQMVSELFKAQAKQPQKVTTHVGDVPVADNQHKKE